MFYKRLNKHKTREAVIAQKLTVFVITGLIDPIRCASITVLPVVVDQPCIAQLHSLSDQILTGERPVSQGSSPLLR